jgi:hypothetical protein
MMPGRKPLPVAVKKIQGTVQKCRSNPREPKSTGMLSVPPELLQLLGTDGAPSPLQLMGTGGDPDFGGRILVPMAVSRPPSSPCTQDTQYTPERFSGIGALFRRTLHHGLGAHGAEWSGGGRHRRPGGGWSALAVPLVATSLINALRWLRRYADKPAPSRQRNGTTYWPTVATHRPPHTHRRSRTCGFRQVLFAFGYEKPGFAPACPHSGYPRSRMLRRSDLDAGRPLSMRLGA